MRSHPFQQVDVFSPQLGMGNALAVVLDAGDLDEATMQRFARWTQLSETCFLLPPTDPQADYRVRIFTPGGELPFAGHPTLGSCHAWLASGATPQRSGLVVQQCEAGLVQVRTDAAVPGRLAFRAPPSRRSDPDPALLAEVIAALGLAPQCVRAAQLLDNGPVWITLLADSAQAVRDLRPDHTAIQNIGSKVAVAHIPPALLAINSDDPGAPATGGDPDDAARAVTVRAFAAPIGITEDPVTGSLAASLAQWVIGAGIAPASYVAHQGENVGRAGRIHVAQEAAAQGTHADGANPLPVTWIGGDVVAAIAGTVTL